MNEAVEFNYFPSGGFTNTAMNKSVSCAKFGAPNDLHCQGDKFEACVMSSCGAVHSCPANQLGFARFLECFEHQHGADMRFADSCVASSGLSVSAVRSCYDNPVTKEGAWISLQSSVASVLPTLECMPWITVGGEILSKGGVPGCFGPDPLTKPLLPYICEEAIRIGVTEPAACATIVSS